MKPWKPGFFSRSTCKVLAAGGLALWVLACVGGIPEPGENHVRWAESHGRDGAMENLYEGRRLFVQKCDGCHSLPRPRNYAPEDWPRWMDSMKVEYLKADGELHPQEDSLIRNFLIVISGQRRDSLEAIKRAKQAYDD